MTAAAVASQNQPMSAAYVVRDVLADIQAVPVHGMAGRSSLVVDDGWRVFYVFGGFTMAAAIRAAEVELGRSDLHMITADATFCQAVPAGPIALQAEVLRTGRRAAQVLVRLWATDDPAGPAGSDLVLTVVFGALDPSRTARIEGLSFPADVPPPDRSRSREPTAPESPFDELPFHRQTEWRLGLGTAPWERADEPSEPRTASWFRFNHPPVRADGTWDPACLAVPGDVLGPAIGQGLPASEGFFFVLSLQIGLRFIAPMRGTWLCQHTRAHHVGEGFASGSAELWSDDGSLVALANQTALLRPMALG